MTILETCCRIIELKMMIKQNVERLKMHGEDYDNLFSETLNMMDELDFYVNQINDIDSRVSIEKY
ncbi:MAG: hypothetical protein GX190_01060 [Mollicutes bacterium]|nr:hypothetical protein [Mollicutes bacterium]